MIEGVYDFGEFRMVLQARELWRAGKRVELPRRTFECLEYLLAHRERAVHRDELVQAIFGRPNVSDAQLGQVVLRTRRALADDGNAQRVIRTIAGYGYRWVAPIDGDGDAVADEANVPARSGDAEPPAQRALPAAATSVPDAAGVGAARAPLVKDPRKVRLRVTVALALAACALVAAVAFWTHKSDTPRLASTIAERTVVLPMRVDGLREDTWVRLGAMDLVGERLRESGLAVPPSENVLGLLHAEPVKFDDTDLAQVRQITGAGLIVHGRATRGVAGWKVELVAEPAQGLAIPAEFAAADAIHAARGATDLLLAALGRSLPADREHDTVLDETLQRARAAMLANELDTARSILSASPQLGAAPDQLAYRLAQVDFRGGRLDQAEATLDKLLSGPAARADAHFRAQVLVARGATRTRRGAFAHGARDFDAALAALGYDGDVLERGKARLGRANSLVAEHRYTDALADFGAARIDLESAGDALGVARVDANLGMLELYRGRPAAALGYLPGAADRFQSFGALQELLLTLTGLIDAQLAMLQHDEASATLERFAALRERITDPDQRVDLLLNRAQVLVGVGRQREAQAALAQAGAIANSGNRVLRARLRALEADLAARASRWEAAATAAQSALADWPDAGADSDRAATALIAQRALLALGRDDEAAPLFDRARDVSVAAIDESDDSADALAMAEWWQHAGDATRAEAWFDRAAIGSDHRGVPSGIVAVAQSRAAFLLAAGRHEEAAAAIGRVAPWASRDFDAALLQLRLFHALGQREPWFNALQQTQKLAGERDIPHALTQLQAADPVHLRSEP